MTSTSRFCAACGAALTGWVPAPSQAPVDLEAATDLAPPSGSRATPPPSGARPSAPPRSRPSSTGSLEGGRFTPGQMLGGRYRIVAMLGQGGMGEVYRAEDLLLGQLVALKFLPAELTGDPDRMERLLAEVRLTRQVSHPNVCRVYDVGEADGHRFFSMELVEGDDLASLLRQVGRFPEERALDVARQLCAGLAAAHERGVIHRDLKPGNILVDRTGQVRIADFGLALAGDARGPEAFAGSPGYMAPEQLAGREATVRSDLFALGVVLYEIFTGKRAYRAKSAAELRQLLEEQPPPRPSEVIADIDRAVEGLILRCLEREPARRPPSALAVAAALPGGDPLAAALAAGQTPSPELVAAAGGEGSLPPARAAVIAGASVLLLLGAAYTTSLAQIVRFVPLDRPPDYLDERARELLAGLGHHAPANATAAGWAFDNAPIELLAERGKGADVWKPLATQRLQVIWRFYRQTPTDFRPSPGLSTVQRYNPRPFVPGEAQVDVDPAGRLLGLLVVQPERDATPAPTGPPRWDLLFAAAGLERSRFREVTPEWNPPVAADSRAAWVGEEPGVAGVPLRLEAAAYHGKPVWYRRIGPWTRTFEARERSRTLAQRLADAVNALIWMSLLGGALVAWRNIRLGRGDRRGALRIAFWFFVAHSVVWLGQASHANTLAGEWWIVQRDLGYNLFLAGLIWVGYMAVEPYLRRLWPETLIGWSRVLAGRLTDPRVGRDVLIGVLLGGVMVLLDFLRVSLPSWRAGRPTPPHRWISDSYVLDVLDHVVHSVLEVLLLLFVVLLGLFVFRRRALAVAAVAVVFFLVAGSQSRDWTAVVATALLATTIAVGLTRFGLLAMATGSLVDRAILSTPWAFGGQHWYTWQSWVGGLLLVALLAFGYRASAAGRPLFAGRLLEV